ncbi:hypothetical protein ITP53_07525 [Nonomuraea sp. K274]|uniref:Secreted protein n=1 Tax=Nonomuraea cypriaca TaxID=1187855 RepID=A0A931EZU5_9ACTN|nr:hypothetical protein [Nonomuraea cypriaca]MBF8185588.1 hypothetical protein [Nonomuraea cypriaca]
MTTLVRRAAVLLATVTAAAGLALPASAAAPTTAAAPLPCPRILAVCAHTAAGELRIITRDEPYIVPPVVRAVNQTPEPWCFFAAPGFDGDRREVAPWETVEAFGFDVFSARRGMCTWS